MGGEGAEHVQRSRGSDALESALEEGVGPREGVVRRGWKRGNHPLLTTPCFDLTNLKFLVFSFRLLFRPDQSQISTPRFHTHLTSIFFVSTLT